MSLVTRADEQFHASRSNTFTHRLHEHPLLKIEELTRLALRHPTVKYHSAHLDRSQSLETVVSDRPSGMSLEDALTNIHNSGSFVFIQNIQNDRLYGEFVTEIMEKLERDVHGSHHNMRNKQAWVFITSPGGTTPYHRDQESAHYFHIKGKKTFWLWDPNDRDVVTQEENEYFHGVYGLKKTLYREALMTKARKFEIFPGDGIYFPYTAPHMVDNGSEEYSISISFTHMTDEDFEIRRINKMNQVMRKFGIRPNDVGHSRLADKMKLATHKILRTTLSPFEKNWKNA